MKRYGISEVFYSLQGEGVRAGTANVFVRFAGCNLVCNKAEHGFDCDTDFTLTETLTAEEIVDRALKVGGSCRWVILTGGEPLLQVDEYLLSRLKDAGYRIALETNGTRPVPEGLNWVCVSPKGSPQVVQSAMEVKVVIEAGKSLPKLRDLPMATHYLVSPAFDGESLVHANLAWAVECVRDSPQWRLSVQQHKGWRVR